MEIFWRIKLNRYRGIVFNSVDSFAVSTLFCECLVNVMSELE